SRRDGHTAARARSRRARCGNAGQWRKDMNRNGLAGKRALVTGGNGGIGAAICRRLAADGCHVYIHAHRGLAAAQTLAAEIAAAGGQAETLAFDVSDREAAGAALAALVEDAPVQIVVNNAGIHDDAVFPGMRAEQWQRVIDVSVNGFFNVTQPLMMP